MLSQSNRINTTSTHVICENVAYQLLSGRVLSNVYEICLYTGNFIYVVMQQNAHTPPCELLGVL